MHKVLRLLNVSPLSEERGGLGIRSVSDEVGFDSETSWMNLIIKGDFTMAVKFGPLIAEMTWEEVRDAIAEGYGVILMVGSTEQHGPHLPLATDTLLSLAVAKGVAERTRTLVASPLYYGYKSKPLSGGGQSFP